MSRVSIRVLKEDFYEWLGTLSVEEIMSNKELLRVIERLERMLLAAAV
jgi:hypothetical protein